MRPSLFILGIFAAALCVAQSAAAQNYPWCAYYGPHFGATNSGFSTFQTMLGNHKRDWRKLWGQSNVPARAGATSVD